MPSTVQEGQQALQAVGERIRAAREDAGLTESALAERLGLAPVTVYLWESGTLDARSRLETIAAATGKELAWFDVVPIPDSPLSAHSEPPAEPPPEQAEAKLDADPADPAAETTVAVQPPEAEPDQPEPEQSRAGPSEQPATEEPAGMAEPASSATALSEEQEALARERERLSGLEEDLGGRARSFEQEASERLAALGTSEQRLQERESAIAEREAAHARASEEWDARVATHRADLEAQAAAVDEERRALALERERLEEQERALAEREAALAGASDEREQQLAKLATELDDRAAFLDDERAALVLEQDRLEEQERVLVEREVRLREGEERERRLARRSAELDQLAAELDEDLAALEEERRRLKRILEAAGDATPGEHVAGASADGDSRTPYAGQIAPSAPRRYFRMDLSPYPNIAAAREIGGQTLVVTLLDGSAVRITAKRDPGRNIFSSHYETAEPGSLSWVPSSDYPTCKSPTLSGLLAAALKEVDSGPGRQEIEREGAAPWERGSRRVEHEEDADPEVSSDQAEDSTPAEVKGRLQAWRRARRFN